MANKEEDIHTMILNLYSELSETSEALTIEEPFIFTPENLIENIHRLGAWSSYGLASEALQYYFPDEYDEDDYCETAREVELLGKLGCNTWHDAIIKYHAEVGYNAPDGFNAMCVNEH